MGLVQLVRFPLWLVRRALASILQRNDTRLLLALPAAGLDEATAHQIVFTLRAAANTAEEAELANQWLAALEVAQIASNRLVWDLSVVEATLDFWVERLRQGQHLRTMLFGQGPVSFAKDVCLAIMRRQQDRQLSATDRLEQRVIVLRGLRSRLAEALAQVHAAASLLHLRPAWLEDARAPDPGQLFSVANQAVMECVALSIKAYTDTDLYATKEFQRLRSQTDFKQTALTQMLMARSKRMFRIGSAASVQEVAALGADGRRERPSADEDAGAARPVGSATDALQQAEMVLGVQLDVQASTSAHSAGLQASALASQRPHILDLPSWLRMPSKYKQHWIRYTLLGLCAGYCGLFLFRHSRLNNSQDLERWMLQSATGIRGAYQEHVLKPLLTVRDELFQTFRQKRSIVAPEDFEADKESLMRMLEDFRRDNKGMPVEHPTPPSVPGPEEPVAAASMDELRRNLDFMMAHYEEELKKPIRNVVSGRLPRTLLIQVQKLKVDTEAAMLQCDQILRANELSIALVAAIPAFLVAGLTLLGIVRWLSPTPPDPRFEAMACRMAMVEVERAVQALTDGESAEEQGILVYRLALVYEEAIRLYRRHRLEMDSPTSEWRNLRVDLVQLAAPRAVKQKARIVKRMMRVYTIFRI